MRFNPLKYFKKHDLSKASLEFSQEILKDYNRHRPNGPQSKVCYAPFKSIFFSTQGEVIACCYNRTYRLGNYPEMSVKEIWHGEKAENLRKYISENNMDHGCNGCKMQILSGDKDGNKAKSKQYDTHRTNSNGYPSVMEFELSNVCNLECEMCSGAFSSLIRKNRECLPPLKDPYDDAFVEQLEEFIPHLEEVKFFGGEPYLIEVYYKIWEKIIELNPSVRITLQTNGTILNNRVKRIMEQTRFHVGISIDSLEKENYERIRINAKFERVMENLEWFRKYCKKQNTFFGISACAMQQNWHELPDFVRYCNKINVPVYFHTVFFPKESAFHTLEAEELQHMVDELSKEKFPTSFTITQSNNKRHYEDTIKQLELLIREKRYQAAASRKLKKFEDLKTFMSEFIVEYSGWPKAVKQSKQKKIQSKLDALEEALGTDFAYGVILSRLDFKNFVSVLNVIDMIETMQVDEMAELARKAE